MPSSNGLLLIPGPRPSWHVCRPGRVVNCRSCGRPFGDPFHPTGWEGRNVRLAEPFLCRSCWEGGIGIELHD